MRNNLGVIPVSVVIPCYRSSATIRRAVNSVVKQVVRPAEIILIDDASNDNSLELLIQLKKEYAQENIIVDLLERNGGPGITRNRGWELSSQPWLAFLDADDTWHPRKLEICWAWILDHPETTLLGHQTQQINDGTETDHIPLPEQIHGTLISFLQMLVANQFYTRTVMVKKSLPFRFMNRAYTEDYLLWLEIVLSREPSYVLNQPLAFSYRPEFSHGGYSGHLWTHEKRELRAWQYLFTTRKISFFTLLIALCWSYIKYIRRVLKGNLA